MTLKKFFNNYLNHIILFVLISLVSCYMYNIDINGVVQPVLLHNDDGTFHLARALSLENITSSPINFEYFNHNGNPANIFYPWLTLFPLFIIMKLTNNIVLSYYIFWFLITFITLEITFWVSRKITQNKNISLLISITYTLSLTRMESIYWRMAVGEALSMTFLPIVLYGIYSIFYKANKKNNWFYLALGMTLIAYTHMLSLLFATLLVAIFFVINLLKRKINKIKFINLIKATVFSLLMTLGFFLPMIQMSVRVGVKSPMIYNLTETSLSLDHIFNSSLNNNFSSTLAPGIIILTLLLICLFSYKKIKDYFYKDCLFIAMFLLIMTSNLFPWSLLQNILYQIQFPWRLFTIITLLVAIVSGSLIIATTNNKKSQLAIVIMTSIIAIGLNYSTILKAQYTINNDFVTNQILADELAGDYFNGVDDYTPKSADNSFNDREKIKAHLIKIGDQWIEPKATKISDNTITFTINNEHNQKTAILPVYAYPGEKVTLNNKDIEYDTAYNGATKVKLKEGINNYTISYKYTTLAIISKMISLIAMIIFIFLMIKNNLPLNNHKNKGL